MKLNFTHSIAVAVLISSIFLSCSQSKEKAPTEPNDTILKAGFIKANKGVKLKIDKKDDLDWYGMKVPAKGYIKIGAKNVPKKLGLEVRFALKQAWEDQKQKWVSDWNKLPYTIPVRDKDTIYFAIGDDHRNNSSSKEFSMKASFIKEFDSSEPNDKVDNSVDLKTGKKQTSYIFPKEDREWYKLKADTQGYFIAKARKSPENIKPEVMFATRSEMGDEMNQISDYLKIPCGVFIKNKGDYYVKLLDNHHNAASQDAIIWKMDFKKEMDETEPNNSFKDAYSVSVPDTLQIATFPLNDYDYFKIDDDSDRKIKIKAEKVGDIKPEIRLFARKDEMSEPKGVTNWKKLPTKVKLKKGMQHYLQFHDNHDNARSTKSFKLRLFK
ncbi:MAG: hypothetical protein ABEH43_06840 [Flavobacteriales bacterium]